MIFSNNYLESTPDVVLVLGALLDQLVDLLAELPAQRKPMSPTPVDDSVTFGPPGSGKQIISQNHGQLTEKLNKITKK